MTVALVVACVAAFAFGVLSPWLSFWLFVRLPQRLRARTKRDTE